MIGTYLLCWAVFPVLALALCTGSGLLVRRASGRGAIPNVLIVPIGLATLVVVGGFFCYLEQTAPLAAPAFAVLGAAGLFVERRALLAGARRWREWDPWPIVAGFGGWIVLAAPVLFSGKPGFTGYVHIVDISYELDLAAHFPHTGRAIPTVGNSGYQIVLRKYLENGYPGGGPWTLGAMSNLMPVDLSWLYQPFLALVSGCTALSAYSLLGRVIAMRPLRAVAALASAQPNVLIAYAVAGGIKELCTASFLVLTAALFALPSFRPEPGIRGRAVLAVPIAIGATFASLTLTTLPWLGVLCVGFALTFILLQHGGAARLRALAGSVQIAVITFVISVPTFIAAFKLLPAVKGTGPLELGNLAAPVPGIAAAGVWITGDLRYPQYAHSGISETIAILVLVLAGIGVIWALLRRHWSLVWLGAAGGVSLYYVAHRYGPWIQLKADCISSPIPLLLAFAGTGGLIAAARRLRPRPGPGAVLAGAVPLGVVAAAVLAGSALLYHDTTLAPYSRLHNLQYIGERFAGQGPTLTTDFEEDAEYYLRDMQQNSPVNGPGLAIRPEINRLTEPGGLYVYDLNEFVPSWVQTFRTIVMRRNPLTSRPPVKYHLAYLSAYYEVWQRDGPATTVYAHIPLRDGRGNLRGAPCATVLKDLHAAGPGAGIVYMATPPGYVQVDSSNTVLRGGFGPIGGPILAVGSGSAVREQPIPVAGEYDIFFGGSVGRPVDVNIDGRHVGTAAYQISYPSEFILIARTRLSRGVHRIELVRGGVSLHPDNGDGIDALNRTIGPLLITPAKPAVPQLRTASVPAFRRLCRSQESVRWVEVVRGGVA
jgi:hypothetical protein